MSEWLKDDCQLTALGQQALTEISAKGGQMTLDSVYTCGERSTVEDLSTLTDLPVKTQKMALTGYEPISSSYCLHVKVTNEDLESAYKIEMIGVYMTMSGFNDGNPFLYLVLRAKNGTADQMTNISKSTYKYDIYLYHTNKANVTITINPQSYASVESVEQTTTNLQKNIDSLIYSCDYSKGTVSVIDDGVTTCFYVQTDKKSSNAFVLPSKNTQTKYPLLIIRNFDLGEPITSLSSKFSMSWYIDNVGPFTIEIPDGLKACESEYSSATGNFDIICMFNSDTKATILNYGGIEDNVLTERSPYNSFTALPYKTGTFFASGNATNAPESINDVWIVNTYVSANVSCMLAISREFNKMYIETGDHVDNWGTSLNWTAVKMSGGSGEGLQTATATFVNSSGTANTTAQYLSVVRTDTTDALKVGDLLSVTLSNTTTSIADCVVSRLDNVTFSSKTLKQCDGTETVQASLVPKHFILKKIANDEFAILTALSVPRITVSYDAPSSSDTTAVKGQLWIRYF